MPSHISGRWDMQGPPLLVMLAQCDLVLKESRSGLQRTVGQSLCQEVLSAACAAVEAAHLFLWAGLTLDCHEQQDDEGMCCSRMVQPQTTSAAIEL
jgi:hypothetical protein